MWMWVYSWGPPFSHPVWCILLLCGWSTCCGYLAVFPRLKGRKNVSPPFFLFYYLVSLVISRYVVRGYDYSCARPLTGAVLSWSFNFVYSVRVHYITHYWTTADQACFCTSQLCLWVNNQIPRILTLNTSSEGQLENVMNYRDLPPHRHRSNLLQHDQFI
jgi:hypothetical protein